ncbi:MAG TPA: lantibiotic dehydratase [Kofleriaceae bacterium]|nr:lantibiotic dehydratase [Kofleriaceae bacterium]
MLSKYFWLRSAGFPFHWVGDLALAACRPVIDELDRVIDELDHLTATTPEHLRRRPGRAHADYAEIDAARAAWAARHDRLVARKAALEAEGEALLADDARRIRGEVLARMATPLVDEALFLLNPSALERIQSLRERGADQLDSRSRQQMRLAWSYLQRLCTKNDTVSYFGPIAWGRMSGAPEVARVRATGDHWLATRLVSFEHWAAVALAGVIAGDPEVKPHLPVSLNPGCHLEGDELHYPIDKRTRLPAPAAELVRWLSLRQRDGARPLAELIDEYARRADLPPDRLRAICEPLLARGVLIQRIAIPTAESRPEARLRDAVAALPAACPARERWLAAVDRLLALRDRYQAGALADRIAISRALVDELTALGIRTERQAGSMYVGRYVVYEDCARAIEVELGEPLERELTAVLGPVCEIYRWLARRAAKLIHDRYERIYDRLEPDPERGVDFLRFFTAVWKAAGGEDHLDVLRAELAAAWARLVGPSPGAEVEITLDDLARLVDWLEEAGPTTGAPEPLGVAFHSPDLMLAARSLDALRAGDYRIIVGEIHPGVYTVAQPVAQPFAPSARDIQAEVNACLAPGRAVLVDTAAGHQRSNINWPVVDHLFEVVTPNDAARVPPRRQIAAGAGRVIRARGQLAFHDLGSGRVEDVITVMPRLFHKTLFALAADALGAACSCRVSCGRFVLKRRTWRVADSTLPDVKLPGESFRAFSAIRQWARTLGLPRWVFVKCPGEPKPVYVDLENPLAVDLFHKLAWQGGEIQISEMRPAPDELWLGDQRGVFTFELRTSFALARRGARVASEEGLS